MSAETPEVVQNEQFNRVRTFFDQPDRDILVLYQVELMRRLGNNHVFFDRNFSGHNEAYRSIRDAYAEVVGHPVEVVVTSGGVGVEYFQALGRVFGMPEEKLKTIESDNGYWELEDYVRERTTAEPDLLFICDPENLPFGDQLALRALIEGTSGKMRVYALGELARLRAVSDQGNSSPLNNIFYTYSAERNDIQINDEIAGTVIAAFRNAVSELELRNTAQIRLPSGSGKSSFSMMLRATLPVGYVTMQSYMEPEGGLRSNAVGLLFSKLNDGVVIVDESQVLNDTQREEIKVKYGKVIFLETTEYTQ